MSQDDRPRFAGRPARWDDERAADAYARGWWVHFTLADSLQDAAVNTPQRVLLVDGDHRLTCQQLHEQAHLLAHTMSARMPAGSVVSFMLPNWYEAAIVYLATTLAGMVVNPVLPSLRERELLYILEDTGSRMLFVPQHFGRHDYASMLQRVTAQLGAPPEVVLLRGDGKACAGQTSFHSLLGQPPSGAGLPTLNPDAVRMILYTSGTTDRPKGVMHSHNSMHALIRQIREHWLVESGDRFLVPSPIGHIGGSIYAFEAPLLLGTTAVLMDRWNADDAVAIMESERCTHIAGATPFLEQILAAANRRTTRLPDLKLFVCGGASVSPSLIRSATEYFEHAIVTRVYGSTEVPITTIGSPLDADHAAETDGQPGAAEVRIVGDGCADGEIRARGPQMLVGYVHQQDELHAFDAEGYFRTGDLGRWVDDEYLLVTGRAKDLIIRNGENISPREIEDVLSGHPDIAEVAVVGVPDARTGERACAAIVPRASAAPDVAALRSYLQTHGVATFKAPEQVVICNALPRNDAGKVLKQLIRASLERADE